MNDTFRTFTWDADGNPVTIGPVSLTYDALDRMVEQSVSGTNSEIVYSPAGVKLALMNGATLTKAFVPLTGGATAVYNSSGLAYYRHTDHLGSSRFASTPTQTLYSDAAYSPFGEPYASSGAIDNSFTGQNQDTTAGLYDFLFREQDPNQTRWTSPDPAGLASANPAYPQSWNRYAYVSNIPMEYVDPTGLFLCGSICDPPPPPPDPGGSGGGGGGAGGSGGGGGCTFFGPGGRCGGGAGGAGSIGGGNPGTPPGCPPGDACDPVSNPNSQTSQCNSIQTTYNQTAMANNFKWAMRFYGAVVGGAALGGPLGAAIGGALQSMNDESASDYANITQNAAQQWIAAGCSGSLQPAFPQ